MTVSPHLQNVPPAVPTVDFHTAGEPFRIVTEGFREIPGATVADRREHALRDPELQSLRSLLCNEPRGHGGMYGGLIVPPDDADGHLGVLFWHREGFSTACGHGTIALGVWAVEEGVADANADGETEVVVDVPSGRVSARVRCERGRPRAVVFRNVPSYVLEKRVEVEIGGRTVALDLAFSGAVYASVAAADLNLAIKPARTGELVAAEREIKRLLAGHPASLHPSDERLSGVYGVIFHGAATKTETGLHQRNVTVFADGEIDRSPCGSGTSARLALLHDEGALAPGAILTHESIVGTTFLGRVTEGVRADGRPAVVTEVEGMAHRTGEHRFIVDPDDSLGTGFLLS